MARRVPSYPYDKSVFLNCPFDADYKPILDAVLFCIHDCGFVAQIALQDVGSQVRLVKIVALIRASRYSIHDLSRIEQPRLNMAFECGLCLGAQLFGNRAQQTKDMLILDAEEHRYKKTMSDVSGQDAKSHHNNPNDAIGAVRSFLARKSGISPFIGAAAITRRFRRFSDELPELARAAHIDADEMKSLDYLPDLVSFMTTWIEENRL
jgi:hypothetical protein